MATISLVVRQAKFLKAFSNLQNKSRNLAANICPNQLLYQGFLYQYKRVFTHKCWLV